MTAGVDSGSPSDPELDKWLRIKVNSVGLDIHVVNI